MAWGRMTSIYFPGVHCGSAGKVSAYNAGDLGLIPGLGRSLGEGKGYSRQYSSLENSMNCIVHGVAKRLDMIEWLSLLFTTWDKWNGNVHGDREYASLVGVENFYQQVLRDMVGKNIWDCIGVLDFEYKAIFIQLWQPFYIRNQSFKKFKFL